MKLREIIERIIREEAIATFILIDDIFAYYETSINDGYVVYFQIPLSSYNNEDTIKAIDIVKFIKQHRRRISFRYDSLLKDEVKMFAKVLTVMDYELFIITHNSVCKFNTKLLDDKSLKTIENSVDIYDLANDIGIDDENVIFTNYNNITKNIINKNILLHLDIEGRSVGCMSFDTTKDDWKEKTNQFLILNNNLDIKTINNKIDNLLKKF